MSSRPVKAILQASTGKYWRLQDPTTRRQRERQNNSRFSRQNNNSASASHLFVHFFAAFARLRCGNA